MDNSLVSQKQPRNGGVREDHRPYSLYAAKWLGQHNSNKISGAIPLPLLCVLQAARQQRASCYVQKKVHF